MPPRTAPRSAWRAFRHDLRLYYGAHLHRRLFLWFGFAIFITIASVEFTARWHDHSWASRPHPKSWFLIIPAVILWMASGKVARRISRPLYELVQVSKDIGNGNLQARARLHHGGFDEIAVLSGSINDMAARIEKQLADQRELLAGVSHELRTPLARLRVLMEIVRERGSGGDTIDQMEREVVEIDALVAELLASARLDFQTVDKRALQIADVAQRALERAGVPVTCLQVQNEIGTLRADPTLLARALANLLDNALKHGKGVAHVRVFQEGADVAFEVQDHGAGFPADALSEEASPRPSQESLGLGLVLVRRIAKAHGGSLQLANSDGGGRAVLRLPLA